MFFKEIKEKVLGATRLSENKRFLWGTEFFELGKSLPQTLEKLFGLRVPFYTVGNVAEFFKIRYFTTNTLNVMRRENLILRIVLFVFIKPFVRIFIITFIILRKKARHIRVNCMSGKFCL
ncbi:unknown [Prevotella sp. CAG:873]|nr:unknown [Prevotella sp. CAG:873]